MPHSLELSFHRRYLGHWRLPDSGEDQDDVKQYEVMGGSSSMAHFYSGDDFCLLEYGATRLQLVPVRRFLKPTKHFIIIPGAPTDIRGEFTYRESWRGAEGTLRWQDAPLYEFSETRAHRGMLGLRERDRFCFTMYNDRHFLDYDGRLTRPVVAGVDPDQEFFGTARANDPDAVIPLLLGLYLIEEKFRRVERRHE